MTKPPLKAAPPAGRRTGFSLVEMLVVIGIIGLLVGLILPAVQSAREAARRMSCSSNLRQLGTALLAFEGKWGRFPAAMDRYRDKEYTSWQASDPMPNFASGAFSWIALILPFLEEQSLYDSISFDTSCTAAVNMPAATTVLRALVCPSYAGPRASCQTTGTSPAVFGVTNYKGCAAVGFLSSNGYTVPYKGFKAEGYVNSANPMNWVIPLGGVITQQHWTMEPGTYVHATAGALATSVFAKQNYLGITRAQINDGAAQTLMAGETKERTNAPWIYGFTNWLSAVSGTVRALSKQNLIDLGDPRASTAIGGIYATGAPLAILDNLASSGAGTFTGYVSGTSAQTPSFGSSSDHRNGGVLHVYADGHVDVIMPDIDLQTLCSLYTRAASDRGTGGSP